MQAKNKNKHKMKAKAQVASFASFGSCPGINTFCWRGQKHFHSTGANSHFRLKHEKKLIKKCKNDKKLL